MPAKLSTAKIALALADATLMGDAKSAKKNGISVKSIENYRAALDPNSPLAAELQKCLNEQDLTWGADLPKALKATISAMAEFAQNPSEYDPETIEAIGKQATILSDIDMTRGILKNRVNPNA